jgi:hypothetical protein
MIRTRADPTELSLGVRVPPRGNRDPVELALESLLDDLCRVRPGSGPASSIRSLVFHLPSWLSGVGYGLLMDQVLCQPLADPGRVEVVEVFLDARVYARGVVCQ